MISVLRFQLPSWQWYPPGRQVHQKSSGTLQAWRAQGGLLARLQATAEAGLVLVDVVWYDSDRRCSTHASEQPPLLADEATGKQIPGLRDTRFASASLHVVPTPDRPLSLAAGYGESRAYAPAYLEGNWTVSRLRPFLRRRLRTSRPHLVAIRSLKPCVRIRRLLRGRYVGLPITGLQKPIKILSRADKTIPALKIGQVTQRSSLLAGLTFPHKTARVARHVAEPRRSLEPLT